MFQSRKYHKSLLRRYLTTVNQNLERNNIPIKCAIMGQTLSEPVTSKESACCQNTTFRVGSSCMQGWRVNMEDSHTHILSLPDDPEASFFAVYDGHGGVSVAEYAGKHLHKYITNRPEYQQGNIPEAMREAFLELDETMLNDDSLKNEHAGSTAVTILVKNNELHCANVGDSRAIACIGGRLEVLSLDHKPSNESEMSRITAAGGWVDCNRVNGNLALSRALGDFGFKRCKKKSAKEQIVTAYPDVETRSITDDWDFIVMACDGIWDVLSNLDVIEFVHYGITRGFEPEEICEKMMMHCLAPDCQMAGLGCDNMTVVLICFLHGKTYQELIDRCVSCPIQRPLSLTEMLRSKDENA